MKHLSISAEYLTAILLEMVTVLYQVAKKKHQLTGLVKAKLEFHLRNLIPVVINFFSKHDRNIITLDLVANCVIHETN